MAVVCPHRGPSRKRVHPVDPLTNCPSWTTGTSLFRTKSPLLSFIVISVALLAAGFVLVSSDWLWKHNSSSFSNSKKTRILLADPPTADKQLLYANSHEHTHHDSSNNERNPLNIDESDSQSTVISEKLKSRQLNSSNMRSANENSQERRTAGIFSGWSWSWGNKDETAGEILDATRNYADCEKGAFIFRVNNWPPFRGEECTRGTHLILETGPLDPLKFWRFNPVGDVEISLTKPVQVQGVTLEHSSEATDMSRAPKDFELFGTKYNDKFERIEHFYGRFTFNIIKERKQSFPVAHTSNDVYQIVRLRFLNSQGNGDLVDVYRIQIN